MTANHDVVVVGGGAVGAACAREIARRGSKVALLEPGTDEGQGWRSAAGMLAPEIEARQEDDPLVPFGVAGRERLVELSGELRELVGLEIGLWQDGVAHVAFTEEEAGELRDRVASQRQQGLQGDWLDAEETAARWPWLATVHGALWSPAGGAVNPVRLVEALRADAVRAGAKVITDRATGIEREGDRVSAVIGRERYAAESVVIAAGAWSPLIEGLPRPLAIAPIRGEMAALPMPAGMTPAIVYGRGAYLVGRGDEVVVGSTMEFAGYRAEVTSAGLARIFAGVSQICPDLARQPVSRTWAGLRPVSPDGRPIIGADPDLRGLWYATGHGRNGILLSAITGLILQQLIAGEPTAVEDLSAFEPGRFWRW